jgi:hypothetical protein
MAVWFLLGRCLHLWSYLQASESAVAIVRSLVVVGFLSFFVSLGRSLDSLSSSEAARFNADLEAMVSQIPDTEKVRMMDE